MFDTPRQHTPPTTNRHPRTVPTRRAGRALAAAVTVALAGTATGTAAATPTPDTGTGCPRWTAVLVPGTGETSPTANPSQPPTQGMLRPIGDGLTARYGADIQVDYLPYAASIAPTYRASESGGVQSLSTLLGGLCESTRVVLAGYSQGADAAGDMASLIGHGRGPIPASRVVAVGLISDPQRDPSTPQLAGATGGQGIAGPRNSDFGDLASRVRTVCAHGDLYCGTSPDAAPALSAIGRAFTGSPTLPDTGTTSSGSGSLSPSAVMHQVVVVLAGLAGTASNIPTVINDLAQLPPLATAGDIPGLHRVSGELNNAFAPLVAMAGQVDLHMVARVLEMAAPMDTSGTTAVAAQIVAILANLDINRLALDIGNTQEIAWHAAEHLAVNDPIGAGLQLLGLVPVVADLAAVAANTLAGDAGGQLAGLAGTFGTQTDPTTTKALADLAHQGTDAAGFYASGVHQNGYGSGVQQLQDWLSSQIDATK